MKGKILLAEDEISLGEIIKESLDSRGFLVEHVACGKKAIEVFKSFSPDIVVLDIMMPHKDGFEVSREIRMLDRNVPIIFLTAKNRTQDVIDGFENGANDFIKKPFSMEELIVRINSHLRISKINFEQQWVSIGKYKFNFEHQILDLHGKETTLTYKESLLLNELIKKRNQVLDRSYILNLVWGTDDFFSARSMDVFITKIRKYLKDDPLIKIVNIRGIGYKLVV
ncbi:response regulator transcription factor [Cecembia lonarensis]|uniref:Transcriptional regulatory protein YycF n=1 Tax=Cecembia lonarensis (strain CCUG 58316 / KCTC 22772 / LW9) TaxID=1225176 RepID=K1M150_CECL9|nr:response regulator transcription factor [Cecembia lonarensis]EKB50064.1 Transcriptional regulatory protein YycF [Cecembia lonarensis LW9]